MIAVRPLVSCWIRVLVGLVGLYYVLEAAANLFYWWSSPYPWYFQLGRLLRLILGILLIAVAVYVLQSEEKKGST